MHRDSLPARRRLAKLAGSADALALARLALAEKQFERTSQLYQQNFSTREQLDADENAVEQDKANVRLRELLLQKATVEAPVSGIVNRVYVESGDYVREGDNLCDIIQTDKLKMIVGVRLPSSRNQAIRNATTRPTAIPIGMTPQNCTKPA